MARLPRQVGRLVNVYLTPLIESELFKRFASEVTLDSMTHRDFIKSFEKYVKGKNAIGIPTPFLLIGRQATFDSVGSLVRLPKNGIGTTLGVGDSLMSRPDIITASDQAFNLSLNGPQIINLSNYDENSE